MVEGDPDAPVIVVRDTRDIVITGLTFKGPSPGQIMMMNTHGSIIAENNFQSPRTAILLEASTGNVIARNTIVRALDSGIELRDGSDANQVSDNVINGTGAPETKGGGIFLHGTRHNRITHNLIENCIGFGIGVSNWDDATINVSTSVVFNIVRNTAISADDSGAIYILGRSGIDTRLVIAGNIVDGVGRSGRHTVGVYLDDSTSGALVTRNLIRRAGSDAIQIHGGSYNRIVNNVLDLGDGIASAVLFQAAPADTNPLNLQRGNTVTGNLILSSRHNPSLYVWYDGGSPLIAANFYVNRYGATTMPPAPATDLQPVMGDPAVGVSYAAAQTAADAAIGFTPLDLSNAGPRFNKRGGRTGLKSR